MTVSSKVIDPSTGDMIVDFDDGLKLSISHHPGTKAARVSRIIKRLNAAKLKAIGQARVDLTNRMSKAENERMQELAAKLASEELLPSEQAELEKEMNEIASKYEDQGANIKAMAEIQEAINPDIEGDLDKELFAFTRSNKGHLSNEAIFDAVFSGKNWVKIEIIRDLIIEHNDFLGHGAQTPQKQADQTNQESS